MRSNDPNDPPDPSEYAPEETSERRQSSRRRSKSTAEIAAVYADAADALNRGRRLDGVFAGRYRRRQFVAADGRVLDVACGTGRNFRYLPSSSEVIGIDITGDVLGYARDELDRLDMDGAVRQMDAQALEFSNGSFDTVISSFSTCTFPDPIAALEEMERVCNPAGEILLLEHSRSTVIPLARLQDWRAESHYEKVGCQLNHDPLATVHKAGLHVRNTDSAFFGLVTTIDAAPKRSH